MAVVSQEVNVLRYVSCSTYYRDFPRGALALQLTPKQSVAQQAVHPTATASGVNATVLAAVSVDPQYRALLILGAGPVLDLLLNTPPEESLWTTTDVTVSTVRSRALEVVTYTSHGNRVQTERQRADPPCRDPLSVRQPAKVRGPPTPLSRGVSPISLFTPFLAAQRPRALSYPLGPWLLSLGFGNRGKVLRRTRHLRGDSCHTGRSHENLQNQFNFDIRDLLIRYHGMYT
ncbi:hypothetical protein J6590_010881 [Homalodisca vitripennis]|nr:hypothetical protein J6590_010881 [Homalodisca vitripennis]